MIKTYTRGNKRYATSTYFDDMTLLKQSRMDSRTLDIEDNQKQKLSLSYATALLKFWRLGCIELSEWAQAQHSESEYITVYKGENWKELEP